VEHAGRRRRDAGDKRGHVFFYTGLV
jgi:hypothetical protein